MPDWVTVAGMVFSAGVTWGVIQYRQKNSEHAQSDIIKDLKECVTKLQALVIQVEVMKASSARIERQMEDHDERIGDLEVAVAKTGRSTRKRGI